MSEPIIKCEHLGFTYTDDSAPSGASKTEIPALTDITASVSRGEYIAVLGHNGSGKSTFAKLLNMILIPTEGKIYIDGRDVTAEDFGEDDVFDVRRKIGMVFQNPDNQLVATTVEEDVAFGPENLGLPREEIRRRVTDALNLVSMQNYVSHAPHKLSGGQKQRIAIAGVIAMKPDVIIFDESTAMLDPLGRAEVVRIMEKLNREEGITVINITHYMDEAARADRVLVINDGRLILDESARNVFSHIELLHGIGLEAPQGAELVYALQKDGFDLHTEYPLTEEESVEAIVKLIEKYGA